ncbi:response regulator [Cohnella fermenti]|uniref:Response regulator n=1 Tax=Cohnella fermenti TaxID=2565925 RepID=A0A4S4BVU1_9BACL|nr:response regulator [Cohnella fermenti]THF77133.1 response regulator [Cohnella fermenti]
MIKLLIVDDEEEIRRGIRNLIDWPANGIEVCGEAGDGGQALQAIDQRRPDIVLLDIRMPEMSGLEVARTMRERKLAARPIILSGYDDFSFARQAMACGVSDYLLKPCLPEDILGTVLKLKLEIESDRLESERRQALQAKLNESLPLLREKRLSDWLRGEAGAASPLPEWPGTGGIPSADCRWIAAIVRMDEGWPSGAESPLEPGNEKLGPIVRQGVAAALAAGRANVAVIDDRDGMAVLAALGPGRDKIDHVRSLTELKNDIQALHGFTVSIGIGTACSGIAGLRRSYEEAVQAIEGRFLTGGGSVLTFKPSDLSRSPLPEYPAEAEKQLLAAIRSGRTAPVEAALDTFFASLQPGPASRERVAKCCTALLMSLYRLCIETRTDPDGIFGPRMSSIDRILKLQTLGQMKSVVRHAAISLRDKLSAKQSGHKTIEQALRFIHDNYDKELSLELVSSHLYVNANYFCLLFKQHMGVGFIDYVHRVRIERACEGMRDFPYKTYEIAAKVGYSNEKYFCRIFKQVTGMTPSQYRASVS